MAVLALSTKPANCVTLSTGIRLLYAECRPFVRAYVKSLRAWLVCKERAVRVFS